MNREMKEVRNVKVILLPSGQPLPILAVLSIALLRYHVCAWNRRSISKVELC